LGAAAESVSAAALTYVERGLHVLPLHGIVGGVCTCGTNDCASPGKHPRLVNGLNGASLDAGVVVGWWERWPNANVGICTGVGSGLVVLDVDAQTGGATTLKALQTKLGKLPSTPRVLTGGGGYHLYFRHPGGEVRCSVGKLGYGLDVRGDGGYVAAPPSLHVSGRPYLWTRSLDQEALVEPPAWVLSTSRNRLETPVGASAAIPLGQRNTTLASIAGTLRRGGLEEEELVASLRVINERRCHPPLPAAEVDRIAHSVAGYPAAAAEPFSIAVMTARQLCALPDPAGSDELLGPAIVRGQRIVVGAHTGQGKTTFALACVRALVLGQELLGWQGIGRVRVLVVDAEQGLRSIKRRLSEAGLAASEAIDYVRVPDGLSLDTDLEHVAEVERILAATDYALVVADPLYKLHSGDSNAEREAVDLMRRFDAWRDKHGFALLLPVHCRKPSPGSKFSIHDLFGSSAYVRGAEVVLGLQRLRDGYSKLHFLKDRDGDLPIGAAWGLMFDRERGFRRDPKDTASHPLRSNYENSARATRRSTSSKPPKHSGSPFARFNGTGRTRSKAMTPASRTRKRHEARRQIHDSNPTSRAVQDDTRHRSL
jgi:hypothetical protein